MNRDDLMARLEELHPDLFGWALSCCDRDSIRAEETLQMTYLKILDGRARFDERSSLRTWVFGVIRVTAAEQRRRSVAGWRALARWAVSRPEPATPASPEARAAEAESAGRLAAALGKLSRRQREILHLVFYEDLTIEEAAGVVGLGLGTARTHYERGKARLRRLLTAEDPS